MTRTSVPISDPAFAGWTQRERPRRLERRLEFPDYATTRAFLDRAAELSEQTGVYPDLSFGRTYVNLVLLADEASGELTAEVLHFAQAIAHLAHSG